MVTRRWKFSPAATADAEEIWRWIAEESPRAADALLVSFDQAMEILSEFPQAGSARDDLGPGIRMLPVERYLLFHRITPNGVELVRIFHGRRDVRRDLF